MCIRDSPCYLSLPLFPSFRTAHVVRGTNAEYGAMQYAVLRQVGYAPMVLPTPRLAHGPPYTRLRHVRHTTGHSHTLNRRP
eukprot:528608-Rhodomonas_salina.1